MNISVAWEAWRLDGQRAGLWSKRSAFEALCLIAEQDTSLSQYFSPPGCINSYRRNYNAGRNPALDLSSILSRGSRNTPTFNATGTGISSGALYRPLGWMFTFLISVRYLKRRTGAQKILKVYLPSKLLFSTLPHNRDLLADNLCQNIHSSSVRQFPWDTRTVGLQSPPLVSRLLR